MLASRVMGFLKRALGLETTKTETEDGARSVRASNVASFYPSNLSPAFTGGGQGAGVLAVPEVSLGVSTVYSAVYRVSASVASMPIYTYDRRTQARVQPTPAVVRQPNPWEASETTYKRLATSLLLYGNAFAYLTAHDRSGRPTVLIPIPSDEVSITEDDRGRAVYRWRAQELRLDVDIAHAKLVDIPGYKRGVGPVQALAGTVAGALKADQLAGEQYTEGAWVDGVLQAPYKLTEAEATRLREQWDASHAGKRGTAVLEGGMTYEAVQMSNSDMQALEGRQWYAAELARAFGIPLPLMGVSSGDSGGSLTYRNIEGVRAEYAQFAVQPVTDPIEAMLSRLIPSTQEPRFVFAALLRADIATRYNVYEKALAAGILTVNEVRELETLPAIPGGDVRTPNASVQINAQPPAQAAEDRDELTEAT